MARLISFVDSVMIYLVFTLEVHELHEVRPCNSINIFISASASLNEEFASCTIDHSSVNWYIVCIVNNSETKGIGRRSIKTE